MFRSDISNILFKSIGYEESSILALFCVLAYYFALYFVSINPLLKDEYKFRLGPFNPVCPFCWVIDRIKPIMWLFFDLLVNLAVFMCYILLLIAIVSNVRITLDKGAYYPDEDIRVEIKPVGIIVPMITYVHYSNDMVLLYNYTNKHYPLSAKLLVINSSILKTDSYNSFVRVEYQYFNSSYKIFNIFGNVVTKTVPVYKRASYEKNPQYNLNLTLKIETNNTNTTLKKSLIAG